MSAPQISVELWERLRRVDRCCLEITLSRGKPNARQWVRAVKTWQVQIHRDPGQIIGTVHVENPRLSVSLTAAVEEAERRGWAG